MKQKIKSFKKKRTWTPTQVGPGFQKEPRPVWESPCSLARRKIKKSQKLLDRYSKLKKTRIERDSLYQKVYLSLNSVE